MPHNTIPCQTCTNKSEGNKALKDPLGPKSSGCCISLRIMFVANIILAVCIISLLSTSSAGHAGSKKLKCGGIQVRCKCGSEQNSNVTVALRECIERNPTTGKKTCRICNRHAMSGSFCSKFKNCMTCSNVLMTCTSCPEGRTGNYCQFDMETTGSVPLETINLKFNDIVNSGITGSDPERMTDTRHTSRVNNDDVTATVKPTSQISKDGDLILVQDRRAGKNELDVETDPEIGNLKLYQNELNSIENPEDSVDLLKVLMTEKADVDGLSSDSSESKSTGVPFGKTILERFNLSKVEAKLSIPLKSAAEDVPITSVRIARGEPIRDNRVLRDVSCEYPNSMETAGIHCIIYTTKVSCTQTCVWGHSLPDGKKRELHCKFSDNKWEPSYFEECTPYVDCNVQILTNGNISCIFNRMDAPPTCDLGCSAYDKKPMVPLSKYVCSLSGEWTPPLPHCIVKVSQIAAQNNTSLRTLAPHIIPENNSQEKIVPSKVPSSLEKLTPISSLEPSAINGSVSANGTNVGQSVADSESSYLIGKAPPIKAKVQDHVPPLKNPLVNTKTVFQQDPILDPSQTGQQTNNSKPPNQTSSIVQDQVLASSSSNVSLNQGSQLEQHAPNPIELVTQMVDRTTSGVKQGPLAIESVTGKLTQLEFISKPIASQTPVAIVEQTRLVDSSGQMLPIVGQTLAPIQLGLGLSITGGLPILGQSTLFDVKPSALGDQEHLSTQEAVLAVNKVSLAGDQILPYDGQSQLPTAENPLKIKDGIIGLTSINPGPLIQEAPKLPAALSPIPLAQEPSGSPLNPVPMPMDQVAPGSEIPAIKIQMPSEIPLAFEASKSPLPLLQNPVTSIGQGPLLQDLGQSIGPLSLAQGQAVTLSPLLLINKEIVPVVPSVNPVPAAIAQEAPVANPQPAVLIQGMPSENPLPVAGQQAMQSENPLLIVPGLASAIPVAIANNQGPQLPLVKDQLTSVGPVPLVPLGSTVLPEAMVVGDQAIPPAVVAETPNKAQASVDQVLPQVLSGAGSPSLAESPLLPSGPSDSLAQDTQVQAAAINPVLPIAGPVAPIESQALNPVQQEQSSIQQQAPVASV